MIHLWMTILEWKVCVCVRVFVCKKKKHCRDAYTSPFWLQRRWHHSSCHDNHSVRYDASLHLFLTTPSAPSVGMPPGTVRLMHMLLHEYIHKDPCRHVYLAVFPFHISWRSLTFNAQWDTHSHTVIFTQFAHHKYFSHLFQSKGISCTSSAYYCVMWSTDQHWGGAYLFDCWWISASQQQVGGVPLLLTWLGCQGQRNSTSVRKR